MYQLSKRAAVIAAIVLTGLVIIAVIVLVAVNPAKPDSGLLVALIAGASPTILGLLALGGLTENTATTNEIQVALNGGLEPRIAGVVRAVLGEVGLISPVGIPAVVTPAVGAGSEPVLAPVTVLPPSNPITNAPVDPNRYGPAA